MGTTEVTRGASSSYRNARLGYRGDIDGLRALAVLLVVAFHAGLTWLSGGFVGVDVFFVISGFLITGMLLDELRSGTFSLLGFYARRVRRLLPLSALVLVATALASQLLIAPLDRAGTGADIRSAALYVSNWHFALQATNYMAADVNSSPVLHYWSLSVEEQFYLAWPLLMLGAVARGRVRRVRLPGPTKRIGLLLMILGLGSWVLSVLTTGTNGPLAYFGTQNRAWELAAGAGLAMARSELPRLPRVAAALAGWAGLLLIFGSALAITRDTPFPGVAATFPVAGSVLVLASGARTGPTGAARLLSGPVIRYVGRLSYAWYLWHWPFLILLRLRIGSSGRAGVEAAVLAVAGSFGMAALTHWLIEDPVRRSRWLMARRRWSLAVGVGLTLASVLAAVGLAASAADARTVRGPVIAQPGEAPVTMLMTPAQARADGVQGMRDCHALERVTTAASDCTFGNPAGKITIALVGDSHAEQWFPALQSLALQHGWRLLAWTKDACLFLDVPILSTALKREYHECDVWRTNVLASLRAAGQIDAVIIGRTASYRFLSLNGDGIHIPVESSALLAAAWSAGARSTFTSLEPIARHIVVLRDTPFAPTNVPSCLSAAGTAVSDCSFPRSDGLYGAGLDSQLVAAEQSVGLPNVSWLDMTSGICGVAVCPAVDEGGLIVYRDHEHLTVTKVLTLRKMFDARLAAILGG